MLYTAFDEFIDPPLREAAKPLYGEPYRFEIDRMNACVYDTINNGVYKCGFATSQAAYDENIIPLFRSLDFLEEHLERHKTPFLFGDHITEADIRLFPTIVRFDPAYVTIFKCNLKMIRYDYPRLHAWLKRLYWDTGKETNGGAFRSTTHFKAIKEGYTYSVKGTIVPAGPKPDISPL